MIKITNLSKSFKFRGVNTKVLDKVNITIKDKEKIGLLGKNGAGKSTLLNIIGGVTSPDEGKIIKDCTISWPIGKSAGFVADMTGRQNVTFVLKIFFGDNQDTLSKKIELIKEFSELDESFDRPFNQYSRGMKSRLSFSLSMAFDFDVYLLDEIMGGGDESFKRKAKMRLNNLVKNKSLIMVTHNLDEYKNYCDKALILKDGKLIQYDNVNEAILDHKKFLLK